MTESRDIHRPTLAERAAECERDMTLSVTVSYDGSPFSGFAKQPGQLTVQEELEYALSLLLRRDLDVVCSGRTDAGVHARAQVVSFDVDEEELRDRSLYSLRRSLNALTHDAISVHAVEQRPRGFSARFDAQRREYRYRICTDDVAPVFTSNFSWHVSQPLDVEAMERAAAYLIGEHDFKSFCMAASAVGKPTCRDHFRAVLVYKGGATGRSLCAAGKTGKPQPTSNRENDVDPLFIWQGFDLCRQVVQLGVGPLCAFLRAAS
ncbi:MAG: hypothetical protein IKL97_02550, partial [Eggerthellaceae bacterium]|nr:hypothetical protein [Eggerthellaceae bacterium]